MSSSVVGSRSARTVAGVICLLGLLSAPALAQSPPALPGELMPPVEQEPADSSVPAARPRALQSPARVAFPTPGFAAPPAHAVTPAPAADDVVSKSEVQKMIADALARKECEDKAKAEQKKCEEEAKKAAEEAQGFVIGSQAAMTGKWNNGLWFETKGGDFRFHVGGTVHYDYALYTGDTGVQFGPRGIGALHDGANMRRGRLRAEGSMWEVTDFVFEMEFFNGVADPDVLLQPRVFNSPGPTDAWIEFKQLPCLGNVRMGSMKEPFSLEHLNGYRYLEFMERSYLFDAFQPTAFDNGFAPGIMAHNTLLDECATWWIGFFKNDSSLFGFNVNDGEYAVTGRLTALPIWYNDGASFWHVGIAGSHRDPVDGVVLQRVRTQVRNGPFPLVPVLGTTGFVAADSQSLKNIETAAFMGSLTIQAEYTASWLDTASHEDTGPVGTFFTQGCYAEVLWFLTGERRTWDRKNAIFNRVIPHEQAFLVDSCNGWLFGCGAWEVGARYSYVDLTSKGIHGGVVQAMTLGLNWYLHPNCKIQWNYDLAHRSQVGDHGSSGFVNAFGSRLAFDF